MRPLYTVKEDIMGAFRVHFLLPIVGPLSGIVLYQEGTVVRTSKKHPLPKVSFESETEAQELVCTLNAHQ